MAGTAAIAIRRQTLDVVLHGSESEGLALQRRLGDVCADVLWPALESSFAEADPGDADLVVERLEIEVPGIPLDRLEAGLVDAVKREVANYLRRRPAAGPGAAEIPEGGDIRLRTVRESADEALVEFLRTGRLPWSFRVPPGSRLEQLVLDAWAGTDPGRGPPASIGARLSEVLAAPSVRARLVMQFTPGFVTTVLRLVSPLAAATLGEVLDALGADRSRSPRRTLLTRRLLEAALAAASAGRRPGPAELARTAWQGLPIAGSDDPTLVKAFERRWPGVTAERDAPTGRDDAEPSTPTQAPARAPDDAEGLLVDNAGLVLLHPFLRRFFDGLGVASGDDLVDPGRALCLLHHLATGELMAPEHQLTLAKVLCGAGLDAPVEADVGLTDSETEEAIAVLGAAIGHWGALGGSGPDALRGEFLMRPGVLIADADGGRLLRVEARTVDILLDQLPWGLSYVALPWMDGPLRVEWR